MNDSSFKGVPVCVVGTRWSQFSIVSLLPVIGLPYLGGPLCLPTVTTVVPPLNHQYRLRVCSDKRSFGRCFYQTCAGQWPEIFFLWKNLKWKFTLFSGRHANGRDLGIFKTGMRFQGDQKSFIMEVYGENCQMSQTLGRNKFGNLQKCLKKNPIIFWA